MDRGIRNQLPPETSSPESTLDQVYVGRWNRLVSTTNWEKGVILAEWRAALIAGGESPRQYSDEAWSIQIGNVSSQHVGRLRRVYERFGASYKTYPGLYWSHFQVALDWEDAEMWLEGAVQNEWSVSQMRRKRWETLGKAGDPEPRDEDLLNAELDQDASSDSEDEAPRAADSSARQSGKGVEFDLEDVEFDGSELAGGSGSDDNANELSHATAEKVAAVRPFETLPSLPEDLAEAFESFKLAILRHKLAGWAELSRDDLLVSLEALKKLALAPS